MDEPNRICPWCSTPIPANANACPKCGALVEGAIDREIPGLTVPEQKATLDSNVDARIRTNLGHDVWSDAAFGTPAPGAVGLEPLTPAEAHEALEPPTDAVRKEMRKIEFEAEIENAGTELMNPTGDESIDAGPPSDEAIAAYEAGLLDTTGPAGEKDLAELAAPWEDPELENRLSQWRAAGSKPGDEPK